MASSVVTLRAGARASSCQTRLARARASPSTHGATRARPVSALSTRAVHVTTAVEAAAEELRVVRTLMDTEQTTLASDALQLAYDANENGWTARAFHNKVDGRGPAVLVGRSSSGACFGGFNSIGWHSVEDYRDSLSAFLFYFPACTPLPASPGAWVAATCTATPPFVLARVGGPALFDFGAEGPAFGADGLRIPLGLAPPNGSSYAGVSDAGAAALGPAHAAGSKRARSRLGSHYARRPDGVKGLFTKAEGIDAELVALRVYVAAA